MKDIVFVSLRIYVLKDNSDFRNTQTNLRCSVCLHKYQILLTYKKINFPYVENQENWDVGLEITICLTGKGRKKLTAYHCWVSTTLFGADPLSVIASGQVLPVHTGETKPIRFPIIVAELVR